MARIQVNRITNANVYLNGASLLGKAEEVVLPEIKATMSDHKALGMVGMLELPTGLDKLEAKIKWNSFYSDVLKSTHNIYEATALTIRTSLETYEGNARVAQVPVRVFLRGNFKGSGAATLKKQDNIELEATFNATYYKLEIGTDTIVEYDALANIYIVDGVDLLAEYRANLGI